MVQDKIYTAGMLRGVFDVFQIILNGVEYLLKYP